MSTDVELTTVAEAEPVALAVATDNEAAGATALASFWASLDVMDATRATYERNMARYVSWLAESGLTVLDATPATLRAYKDAMIAEGKQSSTVQTYLIPVRRFYGWLSSTYQVPNPAAMLKSPPVARTSSRTALSQEQARAAVDNAKHAADDGTLAALRDYALFVLLVGCGLRRIEAHRADVGDLGYEGGSRVLYVQGKGHGSKDDFVVLPDVVLDALLAWIDARGMVSDNEPLFCGLGNRSNGARLSVSAISRIAKNLMRAVGIDDKRLTAHSLRHTAVTVALLNGATIQQAQALARHVNIQTTLRYSHNLERLSNPAINAAVEYLQ